MYAVIKAGGKQYRVSEGERLDIERVADDGDLAFTPVLLVDDGNIVAGASDLAAASVSARVVGQTKGPKIRAGTYKNKSNSFRRWGHRQRYTTIEITGIARTSDR